MTTDDYVDTQVFASLLVYLAFAESYKAVVRRIDRRKHSEPDTDLSMRLAETIEPSRA